MTQKSTSSKNHPQKNSLKHKLTVYFRRVREKAMKIMDRLDSATENELELSSKIIHENIVRYFDHFHLSNEVENQTFLITEYCQVNRYPNINHS